MKQDHNYPRQEGNLPGIEPEVEQQFREMIDRSSKKFNTCPFYGDQEKYPDLICKFEKGPYCNNGEYLSRDCFRECEAKNNAGLKKLLRDMFPSNKPGKEDD